MRKENGILSILLGNALLLLANLTLFLNEYLGMPKLVLKFNGLNYDWLDNKYLIKNTFVDEINYLKIINDYQNLIKYTELKKDKDSSERYYKTLFIINFIMNSKVYNEHRISNCNHPLPNVKIHQTIIQDFLWR